MKRAVLFILFCLLFAARIWLKTYAPEVYHKIQLPANIAITILGGMVIGICGYGIYLAEKNVLFTAFEKITYGCIAVTIMAGCVWMLIVLWRKWNKEKK